MTATMTTKNDLRNWVDNATSDWPNRHDDDVDIITDAIQAADHPAWGTDWSEHLASLDLIEILDTQLDDGIVDDGTTGRPTDYRSRPAAR